MNPVDDVRFTQPLIRDLRHQVDMVAGSLTDLPEDRRRPVAVVWVYLTVLAAWAEDHHLIDPWIRADAVDLHTWVAAGGDMRTWLGHAFMALAVHPSTQCLLDPRWSPLYEGTPSENACRDLVGWWTTTAPSLAYDADGTGPDSITGWLPGDLLQALSDDRRSGNALVQTPWWICDGIIDLTLIRAADDFQDQTLTTIDPTCGTGHFLIRKVDYLFELYTTGALPCRQMKRPGVTSWTPIAPAQAVERILAGVTGVELDPLTTAVARLRMVVTIGDLMHRSGLLPGPLRLDTVPATVRPRVAVGDSLLAGKVPWEEYARLRPQHAAIYGLDHVTPTVVQEPEKDGQFTLFDVDHV